MKAGPVSPIDAGESLTLTVENIRSGGRHRELHMPHGESSKPRRSHSQVKMTGSENRAKVRTQPSAESLSKTNISGEMSRSLRFSTFLTHRDCITAINPAS